MFPSTLSPELSDMKAELIAMPRGQNDGFFKFACKTAARKPGLQKSFMRPLEPIGSCRPR